jgi:hypothetical protein
MKPTVLRLDLTEQERKAFDEASRALNRSMPKQTTYLIRQFLSIFYGEKKCVDLPNFPA